jgi:hypothetical protein
LSAIQNKDAMLIKKEFERVCLDRFLKAIGESPELVEQDERPDFKLWFGERLVGVEVTQSLPARQPGKRLPQEQASLRGQVMELARKYYYAAEDTHLLHVSASFLDHRPFPKSRVDRLARDIARVLRSETSNWAMSAMGHLAPWEWTDELEEIVDLFVIRVPSPDYGAWSANGAAMCRDLVDQDLAIAMSRKEAKLESYRSVVSEVWLLIVIGQFEAGEIVTAHAKAPLSIKTKFDRVFAFEWITGNVSGVQVYRD